MDGFLGLDRTAGLDSVADSQKLGLARLHCTCTQCCVFAHTYTVGTWSINTCSHIHTYTAGTWSINTCSHTHTYTVGTQASIHAVTHIHTQWVHKHQYMQSHTYIHSGYTEHQYMQSHTYIHSGYTEHQYMQSHTYIHSRYTSINTCSHSVRNNGQHSDIFRPFRHFVRPKNVWVRHLAEHYQMII